MASNADRKTLLILCIFKHDTQVRKYVQESDARTLGKRVLVVGVMKPWNGDKDKAYPLLVVLIGKDIECREETHRNSDEKSLPCALRDCCLCGLDILGRRLVKRPAFLELGDCRGRKPLHCVNVFPENPVTNEYDSLLTERCHKSIRKTALLRTGNWVAQRVI